MDARAAGGWLSPFGLPSAHRLMLAIVLALGIVNGWFGEKVPAGGGLGWDGVIYGRMVRDLGGMIAAGELSGYHAQRILPAVIVRSLIAVTGRPASDPNIILFFGIYNVALLLLCCLIWRRIADRYALGLAGRWIGFAGLFLNFQASKYTLYYPVLTDLSALTAGMLMLLFHAEGRRIGLALTAFAGAFCWPTVSLCGAFLLLFPQRDETVAEGPRPGASSWQKPALYGYALLSGLALATYLALLAAPKAGCGLVRGGFGWAGETMRQRGSETLSGWLVANDPCNLVKQALTSFPSILGLGLGTLVLLGLVPGGRNPIGALRHIRIVDAAFAAFAFLGPILVQKALANPAVQNPSSLRYLARIIILPADGQFWMPLVGMAVYWGPLVLIAILAWDRFARVAQRLGMGGVLVIAASLPFGLVGEGRFLTAAWPFIVLVCVLVLQDTEIPRRFLVAFAVVTVALAQFWLPLNIGEWTGGDYDGLLQFPKQMLFLHLGPWMSWKTYFIQFLLCLAATLWLAASWRPALR